MQVGSKRGWVAYRSSVPTQIAQYKALRLKKRIRITAVGGLMITMEGLFMITLA